MKREKEYWPTILIMTGRPYVLKKLERKDVNDPCQVCDLRSYCNYEWEECRLYMLCTSDDRDDAWYFEEDWSVFEWANPNWFIPDRPSCDQNGKKS